jgi:hypothetical protein
MTKPTTYRKNAEECRRLARTLPAEHKETLLRIADAWIACAEEEEHKRGDRDTSKDDPAPSNHARPPPRWMRTNLGRGYL